jgi:hypothetical protein
MKITRLALLIVLGVAFCDQVSAQVKHNFEMGPENTDCGTLDSLTLEETAMVETILQTTFRIRENMQVSRYSPPRQFVFVSCDGKTGYLLVYITESSIELYENVAIESWEQIRDARDPREIYHSLKDFLIRYQ